MPDSPSTNPRQSARNKKIILSTPADDVTDVKGKKVVASKVPYRQRKVVSRINEDDIFEETGDTLEDQVPGTSGDFNPGRGRLPRGMGSSNEFIAGGPPLTLSTPSKTTSSRSKKPGSPSKGLVTVNKKERMKFMMPRITFKTLIDTNKTGNLKGKLQKLWQHINWHEQKVIPSAFKVR